MNANLVLTCDICEKNSDCRIGFSNRPIQPLRVACPHCGSTIHIILDIREAPSFNIETKGAKQIEEYQYAPFDGRNPFLDLHLDFPIHSTKYVMGHTPYFQMIDRVAEAVGDRGKATILISLHSEKLNRLNLFSARSDEIKAIVNLYFGKNKQLFKKRVEDFTKIKLNPSLQARDINAALYLFVTAVFSPFMHHESVAGFVESFPEMISDFNSHQITAFNKFVEHLDRTKFIHNAQRDCLKIYPEIFDAEIGLRPAMFLDLVNNPEDSMIAGRVSCADFRVYKDIYKDLCEILSRQLVIVAGINNIIHRGDYDLFDKHEHGAALSSLDKFSDKPLSEKLKYLDNCWFNLDVGVIDVGIRNAIAHHAITYDDNNQIIKCYPHKEGVMQEKSEQISLLGFTRLILNLFREVNYLNHLIKGVLYYNQIILKAD